MFCNENSFMNKKIWVTANMRNILCYGKMTSTVRIHPVHLKLLLRWVGHGLQVRAEWRGQAARGKHNDRAATDVYPQLTLVCNVLYYNIIVVQAARGKHNDRAATNVYPQLALLCNVLYYNLIMEQTTRGNITTGRPRMCILSWPSSVMYYITIS